MSCFIVAVKCLMDVASLINKYFPEYMEGKDKNKFVQDLYALNCAAYDDRYDVDLKRDTINEFNYSLSKRHELTQLMNFHCYLYQCSEGSVIKSLPFYQELNTFNAILTAKFDQKYVMKLEMHHTRSIEHAFPAIKQYMLNNNIEFCWGN